MDSTTAPLSSALSQNNRQSVSIETITLVAELADAAQRQQAARKLAMRLGAQDLIVFVMDQEIGILLPAPGFPQTIAGGRAWQSFLDQCVIAGQHTAELPYPDTTTRIQATGLAMKGRSVLVLLGNVAATADVAAVQQLLPLLEATFLGEQAIASAHTAMDMARATAEDSRALTVALDAARADLRRALDETETIIESIPDAVFVYDTSGEIVRVNASGAALLGLTIEQVKDLFATYTLFFPDGGEAPRDHYLHLDALRGLIRRDQRFTLRKHETDKGMQLLMSAAPIYSGAGRITGAVVVATDITELHQLERQKDEFLSIASHELRTPLTTLKGLTQLTRRRFQMAGQKEASYMLIMEKAIERMERLIRDFLDISRIEAGNLALRLERCDLNALCKEAVEEQSAASNRTIALEVPKKRLEIEADAERIGQVIINLLSNALKYSAVDRLVALTLTKDGNKAMVKIHDAGVGIPPDALPKLFERYYRVAGIDVQSGSEQGLGLGLFICRNIIERHHGQIGVESALGQGSIFWFALPLTTH